MFDKEDPKLLWVCADAHDGDGTYEQPFETVSEALKRVQPGETVVLKDGIYHGDTTIEISGTALEPIRITADENARVEITGGCWFLYDVSDIIISGLTFSNSPFGAISLIGECKRNRLEFINFINCSTSKKTSCTLYFGGSGGQCNVVENCTFHRDSTESPKDAIDASVGIMISEGDADNCPPLTNYIIRRNSFKNYDYGILLGSNIVSQNDYGHIVEYNTLDNCYIEGIMVKSNDIQVRGNLVRNCKGNSISVMGGKGTVIEDNRIQDCQNGLRASGAGHTIVNNCVIRCANNAIHVHGADQVTAAATNLLIESNTIINCGNSSPDCENFAAVEIDEGTTFIMQGNLIYGKGKPYVVRTDANQDLKKYPGYVIIDNAVAGECTVLDGTRSVLVNFSDASRDNFENDTALGARGWMVRPEAFDPDLDTINENDEYLDINAYSFEGNGEEQEDEADDDDSERIIDFSNADV